MFGAVGSRGLALLASIITARLLGKASFGEFGILQNTALMFGSFASFGMGLTATKYVAEYRISEPARAGRVIGMTSLIAWGAGLLMAIGVAIAAPWIATRTLAAPELGGLLRLSTLCVLFNVVSDAQLGSLSGLEAFKRRSMVQLWGSVCSFPCALVGVYLAGLTGAVAGLAASQGLIVLLNAIAIRSEAAAAGVPIRWDFSAHELKIFTGFSFPTLLGGLVYIPAIWLANTIVVNQSNGYLEMGGFSAADRWRTAIMFIPGLLGGVALPMLANLRSQNDTARHRRVLLANVRLSFICALGAAAPIALGSYWIMAAYGSSFIGGHWNLVGLCVVAVVSATSWILVQSIVSEGRMWMLLMLNITWALLLVGFCWFLRGNGAMALVVAYLVAETARLGLLLLLFAKKSEVLPAAKSGSVQSPAVSTS